MDPVTTILTALAAGAGAAAKDTASQVIKDAYAGLKALVLRKLQAKDPRAASVVDDFEKDPTAGAQSMETSLAAADVASDDALLTQAQRLLEMVQQSKGKFNVQVSGDVKGQVIGDHAEQHNVFGKE